MRLLQHRHPAKTKQHGAALMIMLIIMVMGAATFLVSSLNSTAIKIKRDEITAGALAQAKDALIARAILDTDRPGSLPCPDTDDDGLANSCSSSSFIGRLPWKTLGINELRDGNGEHLWYALSSNLRDTGSTINSNTIGQLGITGNITMSDIAAIVFAPGSPLASQSRDTTANRNNVANYLEGDNANADVMFVADLPSDTFNDRLLAITTDMLFPLVEKRLIKEISNCIKDYASTNNGRYPWAAPLDSSSSPAYDDKNGTLFGRLPDYLGDTNAAVPTMSDHWPGSSSACNGIFTSSPDGWWMSTNWRELVFYSLASTYAPASTAPAGCDSTCLTVNPLPSSADKKVVVMMAGKKLTGQTRSNNVQKAMKGNYLEDANSSGDITLIFKQGSRSNTFNDTLLFQ